MVAQIEKREFVSSTALAVVDGNGLPDLDRAAEVLAGLDGSALDEVRRRAEAHALYERRAANKERERHFAQLRLLAEAALGVLSFDQKLDENLRVSSDWRALAAAFERKQLLRVCEKANNLGAPKIAKMVRDLGLTYVPEKALGRITSDVGKAVGLKTSVPWSEARVLVRKQGLDPVSLPADVEYVRWRKASEKRQGEHLKGIYRRAAEQERAERTKTVKRLAAAAGPKTDKVFSLLRQALDAADGAQHELRGEDRKHLEDAMHCLYRAEDYICLALRHPVSPNLLPYR